MYRLCNWIIIWDIRVCQNVAGCSDGVMTQPEVDMAKKQVAGYILEKLGGLVAGCS